MKRIPYLMPSRLKRLLSSFLTLLVVLGLSGGLAWAQDKKAAADLFEKAEAQYNLGNFAGAVESYKAAYEEWPDSVLLFNIAQAYRQLGDCRQALFFYRRYLLLRKDAPNKAQVERTIADLEEQCKKEEEVRKSDPQGTEKPVTIPAQDAPSPAVEANPPALASESQPAVATSSRGAADAVVAAQAPSREIVAVRAAAGPAFLIGIEDSSTELSLAASIAHPLAVGPASLEVGVLGSVTPIDWDARVNEQDYSGTATLVGFLGNVGIAYPVLANLSIRGELGAGVLLFTGLDENNTFTEGGRPAEGGPLAMVHGRAAVGAEFAITPNVAVQAYPLVFAYSPAADGLRESIDSVSRYELLIGASFRM